MNGNQLLGHWTCERGGNAEVYQTKKRGSHFYTRCECCGLNQGTGAGRQQDIYDKAVFLPGLTVVKPSNVGESKAKVIEAGPVVDREKLPPPGDFDPTVVDPNEVQEPVKKAGGVLLPLSIFVAALGAGIWIS